MRPKFKSKAVSGLFVGIVMLLGFALRNLALMFTNQRTSYG